VWVWRRFAGHATHIQGTALLLPAPRRTTSVGSRCRRMGMRDAYTHCIHTHTHTRARTHTHAHAHTRHTNTHSMREKQRHRDTETHAHTRPHALCAHRRRRSRRPGGRTRARATSRTCASQSPAGPSACVCPRKPRPTHLHGTREGSDGRTRATDGCAHARACVTCADACAGAMSVRACVSMREQCSRMCMRACGDLECERERARQYGV
jgi:hypothetical protein